MTRPNAQVDRLRDLSRGAEAVAGRPAAGHLVVTFESGQTARLDLSSHRAAVWAEVLESRLRSGQPVYVEVDPESGLITELLLPMRYRVGAIEERTDGLEVQLDVSQAVHRVQRSNPDFEEIRAALAAARERGEPILVTEALDGSEVIDARPPLRPSETGG